MEMEMEMTTAVLATSTNNNNYTSSEEQRLPSSIQDAIEDFLAGFELKAARIAAGMAPADDLEEDIQEMIKDAKQETPTRSEEIQRSLVKPLQVYRSESRYRAYASVDVHQPGAVERVDLVTKHRAKVSSVIDNWVHIPTVVDGLSVAEDDNLLPQAGYRAILFSLLQVKCVKDTKFEFGSDEVYCGASFVDETGDFSTFDPFRVGSFRKGKTVDYDHPGKLLQRFNIREAGNKFPKVYTSMLTLVEKDSGSISKWFGRLFKKLKLRIKEFLAGLGVKVGQLIGLGPASGLLGSIFGKIFDRLVKWVRELFGNDLLGTRSVQLTINNYNGNWISTGTNTTSGWKKFTGARGDYRVQWRAQLVK